MLFKHGGFLDWKALHYQQSPPVDTFATRAGSGKLLNCILCKFYSIFLNSWAHSSSLLGDMHSWQWNVWGLYTHKRGPRMLSIAEASRSHRHMYFETCSRFKGQGLSTDKPAWELKQAGDEVYHYSISADIADCRHLKTPVNPWMFLGENWKWKDGNVSSS